MCADGRGVLCTVRWGDGSAVLEFWAYVRSMKIRGGDRVLVS
jgi:hypothetical protein